VGTPGSVTLGPASCLAATKAPDCACAPARPCTARTLGAPGCGSGCACALDPRDRLGALVRGGAATGNPTTSPRVRAGAGTRKARPFPGKSVGTSTRLAPGSSWQLSGKPCHHARSPETPESRRPARTIPIVLVCRSTNALLAPPAPHPPLPRWPVTRAGH
jgi:hypothetical protein